MLDLAGRADPFAAARAALGAAAKAPPLPSGLKINGVRKESMFFHALKSSSFSLTSRCLHAPAYVSASKPRKCFKFAIIIKSSAGRHAVQANRRSIAPGNQGVLCCGFLSTTFPTSDRLPRNVLSINDQSWCMSNPPTIAFLNSTPRRRNIQLQSSSRNGRL